MSLYRVVQKYIDTGVYIGWYWICTCWWSLFGLIPNNIGLIQKVIQVDTIYRGWKEFYSYTEWLRLLPKVCVAILIFIQGVASTVFIFYADSEFEFNEAYAGWFWRLFKIMLIQGDTVYWVMDCMQNYTEYKTVYWNIWRLTLTITMFDTEIYADK